jgi:type I restriction enzyme M protein
VSIDAIKANDYNLNIPLYVEKEIIDNLPGMEQAMADLKISAQKAWEAEDRLKALLTTFNKNKAG